MNKALTCVVFLSILLWSVLSSYGQADTSFKKVSISLNQYLSGVGKNNLDYIAEQYNVSIVAAGIESAKVFPDPEISLGAYDNQESTLHLGKGYSGMIGTSIELGGKRRARIGLARSQAEVAKALLQDFFRNLRADAAIAYFNALQQYHLFRVVEDSYRTMKQLADADSIRFKLGAISEIDARQSRLEAGSLLNNLFQGEADWKTALIQLSLYTGKAQLDTFLLPSGDFNLDRDFSLAALISEAQLNRTDAVAAQNAKTVAEKSLQLTKANRSIDLGLSAGVQYVGIATNEVAPTPAYRALIMGISMPLKFSNIYKGELNAGKYAIRQSELQYEQILLRIQHEVTRAYLNYKAAEKQVLQFNNGLLTEAEKVLSGKIYSYKRGEISLLDVLNAQRTYNVVQQSYYQSLYGYAEALILLERSAGIWDIS